MVARTQLIFKNCNPLIFYSAVLTSLSQVAKFKFHVYIHPVGYSVLIMHTSKRGVAKPNKIFQYVCYDKGHPHLEC